MPIARIDAKRAKKVRGVMAQERSARQSLEAAQRQMQAIVDDLRAQGTSWTAIGAAIGISRQAAQQRYGKS